MAADNLLSSFGDDLARLRQRGVSRGLSDEELDRCMLKSAEEPSKPARRRAKQTAKGNERNAESSGVPLSKRALVSLVKYGAVFYAFAFLFCGVFYLHEPTEMYVLRAVSPYIYSFTRLARLAALPIVRRMDLTAHHDDECIVANPYYTDEEEVAECETCAADDVTAVRRVVNLTADDFYKRYALESLPVVITDLQPGGVTLERLQAPFSGHRDVIHTNALDTLIECNDARVTSLNQLLNTVTESDIRTNSKFHARWTTSQLNHGRLLRTVFRRLAIFPRTFEISLQKTILIDVPNADSYTLPDCDYKDIYYIQGSGLRLLKLVPQPNSACKTISVTMLPGDTLYVPGICWKLESHPMTSDNDDVDNGVSIALLGSFVF